MRRCERHKLRLPCARCSEAAARANRYCGNCYLWFFGDRCPDCDRDAAEGGDANAASEQWRPVPGYEGYYEVSSLGQVRSLLRVVPSTGPARSRTIQPRILKKRLDHDGYPIVTLTKNSHYKLVPIHRLVALAFHGPCPDGQECAHLDGNRENPRADNLTWATKAENEAHKYLHGTRQARAEGIAQRRPND